MLLITHRITGILRDFLSISSTVKSWNIHHLTLGTDGYSISKAYFVIVCPRVYLGTRMRRLRDGLACCSSVELHTGFLFFGFFRQRCLTRTEVHGSAMLAGRWALGSFLSPPHEHLDRRYMTACPALVMDAGSQTQVLLFASALPPERSPPAPNLIIKNLNITWILLKKLVLGRPWHLQRTGNKWLFEDNPVTMNSQHDHAEQ